MASVHASLARAAAVYPARWRPLCRIVLLLCLHNGAQNLHNRRSLGRKDGTPAPLACPGDSLALRPAGPAALHLGGGLRGRRCRVFNNTLGSPRNPHSLTAQRRDNHTASCVFGGVIRYTRQRSTSTISAARGGGRSLKAARPKRSPCTLECADTFSLISPLLLIYKAVCECV